MDAERRSQGSAGQWGFIGQSFSYSLLESRFCLTLISSATHVGPRATSPWTNMCVQNTLSLLILSPLDTRGCIWKQRVSSLISGALMSFVRKVKKDWRDQSSAKTAGGFFFRKGFRFPEVSSTYYQKNKTSHHLHHGSALSFTLHYQLRFMFPMTANKREPEWKWQQSLLHVSLSAKAHWLTLQSFTRCGILIWDGCSSNVTAVIK